MPEPLQSLFVVMIVAALSPLVTRVLPLPVPQVVVQVVGGVLIGPEVLGLASRTDVELLASVGLGLLFLLAGYELPPRLLGRRPGKLAIVGWAASLLLALVVVGGLAWGGFVRAFVPVSLALTTTALGTLLPILRDHGMLGGRLGPYVFAVGAVGELGPVVCISLFLGASGSWSSVLAIATITVVAWLLARVARRLAATRIGRTVAATQDETSQSTLRWTIVLLVGALLLTRNFGLDIVLGAFLAGMALRGSSEVPESDHERLLTKLDSVAYGFFVPIFFIYSGMGLDVASIADNPGRMGVFLVLLLLVRGAPVLLVYRRELPRVERVQLMLLSATALPLLVALAEIGLANGTMLPENAAALVGAGALSVAVFPLIAVRLRPAAEAPVTRAASLS